MPDIYGISVYKPKYNINKHENPTQEWDTREQ